MGLQLRQPGPIVTKQGPFKLGKVFPLLENSAAAARWVPAVPTELIRGPKAHRKARGNWPMAVIYRALSLLKCRWPGGRQSTPDQRSIARWLCKFRLPPYI